MDYRAIRFQVEDGVGFLTLSRPEKLNAMDAEMRRELSMAVAEADTRPDLRVLVITGEGRAFSAGGDLSLFERSWEDSSAFRGEVSSFTRTFDRLEALEKPVLAAINGICTGAGLQLTLSCDLRIASESATFAFLENNIGLIPAAGGCSRLVKLLGYGKAKELILLGEKIPADEAHRMGLVSRVVPDRDLLHEATLLARGFLKKAPQALGLAKRILQACVDSDLNTGRFLESLGQSILVNTREHREGIKAFHEKRKPKFS